VVYRTLPIVKAVPFLLTVSNKCLFSISFSEEMVGLLDFVFVCKSFIGVRHSKNIQKSDIEILDLVTYFGGLFHRCEVSSRKLQASSFRFAHVKNTAVVDSQIEMVWFLLFSTSPSHQHQSQQKFRPQVSTHFWD